jgi:ribose/xylose/arabinose/galactoside ABC-type transport system permease subunit
MRQPGAGRLVRALRPVSRHRRRDPVSEIGTAQWNANNGIEYDTITASCSGASRCSARVPCGRALLGPVFLEMIGNGVDLLATTPDGRS